MQTTFLAKEVHHEEKPFNWKRSGVSIRGWSDDGVSRTDARDVAMHPTDITGCLEPVAKEYLVRSADGTEWGINENDRDLRLNNYIGRMVIIVGNPEHASKAERKEGGASHYLYARDVMVAGESCQK